MPDHRSTSPATIRALALFLAGLASGAAPAAAQYLGRGTKTAAEVQIADIAQLRDKFLALAEAFPADLYAWRPMEGVRSVADVMALIAAEGTLFHTMWAYDAPAWVADGGFGGELQRLGALDKAGLTEEIRRSFEHLLGVMDGLSEEDRARQVNFFGLTVDLGTAIILMATDMHEHLGQSIAYARMNRIVPPWSQADAP